MHEMQTANLGCKALANGIWQITLDRPQVLNAFDDELIAELTNVLNQLEQDPEVRVIMLTGSGKAFSAGADLNWMQRMIDYSEKENYRDSLKFAELMSCLYHLQKPTIALVNGAAFGGAAGIVCCCDMAIAAHSACFCFSEVKLGLIPAVICPYVVNAIGPRMAKRFFLTAEKIRAEQALKLQIVNAVVEDELLLERGIALAKTLLQNGPEAIVAAKNLIHQCANEHVNGSLTELTARAIAKIRVGKEAQHGMMSFLNKQPIEW